MNEDPRTRLIRQLRSEIVLLKKQLKQVQHDAIGVQSGRAVLCSVY